MTDEDGDPLGPDSTEADTDPSVTSGVDEDSARDADVPSTDADVSAGDAEVSESDAEVSESDGADVSPTDGEPAGARDVDDSSGRAVEGTPAEAVDSTVGEGPRDLHWVTILYRLYQQGIGLVIGVFIIGGGSITSLLQSGQTLVAVGAAVAIVATVVAVVGYQIAYYRRYEYELTPDTFDIRSGVFSRREREIPLRRIQNVDITETVSMRMLGVAMVELETAGGGGTEAQLKYVGADEADRLQAEISRLSRAAKAEAEGREEGVETDAERFDTVFSITERELGVLALVSVDLRLASLLFAGASVFAPSLVSEFGPEVVIGPEAFVQAFYGPLAGLAVVVALALLSGLLNAARYYGFTLDRGEDELRYERGLLQKFRGTIPLEKVQSLTIRENVLARAWGYASLYIETAGSAAGGDGASGSQSAIPLAERDRVVDLAGSLEPADLDSFERPPKRARWRYVVRYALVLLVLAGLLYVGQTYTDYRLFWYIPLAGIVLVPLAAHLKWQSRGYAVGDEHVVTRNGFWVRETKVVPLHRVQTVFSSETVFQRRRRLGTVTVDTAGSRSLTGGDAKAVDVDVETVERLREDVSDGLYVSLRRRAAERDSDRSSGLASNAD